MDASLMRFGAFFFIQKHSLLKMCCQRSCAICSKAASVHISSRSCVLLDAKAGAELGLGQAGLRFLLKSAPEALWQRACTRAAYASAA